MQLRYIIIPLLVLIYLYSGYRTYKSWIITYPSAYDAIWMFLFYTSTAISFSVGVALLITYYIIPNW